MVAGNDLGEVGIDTKTKGQFRVVFQSLIATGSFNVGTLLIVRSNLNFYKEDELEVALFKFPIASFQMLTSNSWPTW
jgi:hypothetical protein